MKYFLFFFAGPPTWANWFLTWSKEIFYTFSLFLAPNKPKEDNPPPPAQASKMCITICMSILG